MKRAQDCTSMVVPVDEVCGRPLRRLHVQSMGLTQTGGSYRTPLRRVDGRHLLYYVLSGRFGFTVDDLEGTVREGELLAAPNGSRRQIRADSATGKAVFVHLGPDAIWEQRFRRPGACSRPWVPAFGNAVQDLLLESTSPRADARTSTAAYGELLACFLGRERDVEAGAGSSPALAQRFSDLWQAVATRPEATWTVQDMAAAVAMSVPHFHARCVQCYGSSPHRLLTVHRMRHARFLLLETDDGLDHIAEQVGYASAHSFSRAFLQETGMRPGMFRREGGQEG